MERARQPGFFFWWITVNVIENILYLKKHDSAEKENKTDFLNNSSKNVLKVTFDYVMHLSQWHKNHDATHVQSSQSSGLDRHPNRIVTLI